MPPVMEERNPLGRVLEKDEQLVGFDTCKYIFTDITYGVSGTCEKNVLFTLARL